MEFHFKKLMFSGGQEVVLDSNSIVFLVGPNNSGKSTALRHITASLGKNFKSPFVVCTSEYHFDGSEQSIRSWLDQKCTLEKARDGHGANTYKGQGVNYNLKQLETAWANRQRDGLGSLINVFVKLMKSSDLQGYTGQEGSYDALSEGPTTAIQQLFADPVFEESISKYFFSAFGVRLFVNRHGGAKITLHVGDRPELDEGEFLYSPTYLEKIKAHEKLFDQGDGLKSFAGAVLGLCANASPVLMFDEPEIYLHPPQAHELGKFIARDAPMDKQIIIATHNVELISGAIESDQNNRITIVRMNREDDVNHAHQLMSEDLRLLWGDPLLRYSNSINSVFHEKAVICEGDGDCRFYSAVASAIYQSRDQAERNMFFVPTGGKHRIKTVARALVALSVPVSVIVDIDILNNESDLRDIFKSLGQEWEDLSKPYRAVKTTLESGSPPLNFNQVQDRISEILKEHDSDVLTTPTERKIREAMRATSPWKMIKKVGLGALTGQALIDARQLFDLMASRGVLVLEVGELERFVPSIGNHGPKWVAAALERDLVNDMELDAARTFVAKLLD